MEPSDGLPSAPGCSISSTLNPQAPEFILGCTASKKSPQGPGQEATPHCLEQPGPALASSPPAEAEAEAEAEALEHPGGPGALGQRERKRKKKRPPGYYSYLKDGADEGVPSEALVNGHAGAAGPGGAGAEDTEFGGDVLPPVSPRTCGSPQNPSDCISDTVPDSPFAGTLDGASRTVGQGPGPEQLCPPAEHPPRTAAAPPHAAHTTEHCGVPNGQGLEPSGVGPAANGEPQAAESESLDPDPASSLAAPLPAGQPAKSWASLFHDAKPAPSSAVAYVEVKCSPPALSPLGSEKQVEVKEGLVPVSEDPVAMQIAGTVEQAPRRDAGQPRLRARHRRCGSRSGGGVSPSH